MGFHGNISVIQIELGGTQSLTAWMGCHDNMSAIELGLRTVTHFLDGMSHDMSAIQIELGGTQLLTRWMATC